MRRLALFSILAVLSTSSVAAAAVLEVPFGDASGIGYVSGWKCPPNSNITISFDGGPPIPVATGIRRNDTATVCGNDGRNGFISQFNFNLLGDGEHTISVRQNGVEFAKRTFRVTTFGTEFLAGASGAYILNDFPQPGQSATIQWSEGAQNFVIVGRSGGGPATGLAGLIGTWDFTFTIISTFTERYFFDRVQTVSGIPTLIGEDEIGQPIIVTRVQDLDPGNPLPYEYIGLAYDLILCDGYLFNQTGPNTVAGIHTSAFLVDDECGDFFGEHPMTGVRVSGGHLSAQLDRSSADAPSAAKAAEVDVDPVGDDVARVLKAAENAVRGR
ncbi:MAG TPA: hypothetical protein VIS07_06145 [Candidatus Binatia bacterium]